MALDRALAEDCTCSLIALRIFCSARITPVMSMNCLEFNFWVWRSMGPSRPTRPSSSSEGLSDRSAPTWLALPSSPDSAVAAATTCPQIWKSNEHILHKLLIFPIFVSVWALPGKGEMKSASLTCRASAASITVTAFMLL